MRGKNLLSALMPRLTKIAVRQAVLDNIPAIDFPRLGERIRRGHYAIRISAPPGECHVAIDGGCWRSCRRDSGYFWYDWRPEPGSHHIMARNRSDNGWGHTETTCVV
ncbi:MAG: hypothetical protein HY926_14690, partial [Elusimicrobia bacterium]|nr:hypothetical protein [Elusimicrobiota bacterium]